MENKYNAYGMEIKAQLAKGQGQLNARHPLDVERKETPGKYYIPIGNLLNYLHLVALMQYYYLSYIRN